MPSLGQASHFVVAPPPTNSVLRDIFHLVKHHSVQAALSSGHKPVPMTPCCEQDSVLLQGGQVDALSGVSRWERREESRRLSRW